MFIVEAGINNKKKIVIKATAEEVSKKVLLKTQKLSLNINFYVHNQGAGWLFTGNASMCPPQ